ncbi:MAG: outer membrane beta-barrel family protein [Bacteroidota bacterium]
MLKSLLLLFALLFFQTIFAQRPQGGRPGGGERPMIEVIGTVMDSETNNPLGYATITLFSKRDSSVVAGTITDEEGKFKIETRPGRLFAKVEFISYENVTIEQIPFERGKRLIDLGTISLAPDATTLAEVEVRAEKSEMQMMLDKRVFNVGKDLANMGGSAVEILDNVPSVTVDVEGEVSLRGGAVRILVDGKPSGLINENNPNGLRAIPANLIERIEVITNPSARYEAEGMTGIINIVLKKDKKKGLNGSFDLNAGYPENFGAAANLNFRRNKLNFFANYGVRYRRNPGIGLAEQERLRRDTLFFTDIAREALRGGWSNNFRFGADYFFTDNDILTTSFLYSVGLENNLTELEYSDYVFSRNNRTAFTERTDDESENESNLEYSLTYKKNFKQKGHELTADFRFQDDSEVESSDFTEVFFDGAGNLLNVPNLLQRSNNDESSTRALIRVDYVYPFSENGRFEIGYQGSLRTIDNDYLVEELNDGQWKSLPGLSNDFNYDENIHGLYATFGNKVNKFSYQFGLRAEHSDVRTELEQTNEVNDRQYANLFPSAFFTYDLPKGNAVQLSYSRRIRRPRFWDLNPFFTFSDARNFFAGNPNLDPELTDSYELGHIKYWEKGTLSSSVYYRHTEDVIQRLFTADEQGNTVRRPENIATENSYGLEFTYSYNPVKWWRINGDFNFFRAITSGEFVNAEGVTRQLDADALTWFTRLTSRTTFGKNTDLQVRVNYRAPRVRPQGKTRAITSVDLGLSRDILKGNGTLTLSVRDLFNSRKYRYVIEEADFYSENLFQRRARQATLTFNYRLNQKKRRGGRGNRGDYGGGGEGEF